MKTSGHNLDVLVKFKKHEPELSCLIKEQKVRGWSCELVVEGEDVKKWYQPGFLVTNNMNDLA